MIRTRVLVIGGGPAGSTAARFLAKNNIETLLIDRDTSFVKPCGGGIPSSALEELGVAGYHVKNHVDTVKIVSPNGDILNMKLNGGSIDIVERGDFDSFLRNEAVKSGARFLEAEFRDFENSGKTIVSEVMIEDKKTIIHSDYVIAADGVNSRARAALNIKPAQSFITLSEKIKGENTDFCEFWFGSIHAPQFYSWVFPQKDGISAGTGSFYNNHIKALWHRFAERRGLKTGGSLRGYKIPLWDGQLYYKGRILFAGDSAGQVMPLSCEGIYYAMKSGEFAATAIIEGKIGEYKKLWEKRFHKRFLLMKHLWRYFLKNDNNTEQLVQLHKRPEVQEASMRLWLRKDMNKGSLLSYIKIFKGFLG